jgi:hypothetical protein
MALGIWTIHSARCRIPTIRLDHRRITMAVVRERKGHFMSNPIVVPVPQAVSLPTLTRSTRDRWFFGGMAVTSALTVFWGFAPTYYLRTSYGAPSLSPLVHLHGVVFTGWMVLYVVQTALIAAKRTVLHRRLGVAGAVLALAMIVLGVVVAITAARRPPTPGLPPGFPSPLMFLVVPLGDMVAFGVLVSAGLYNRRHRDIHKRLMLLATIAILNAALGRLVFPGGVLAFVGLPANPVTLIGLTSLFVAACLGYDRATLGRIHPVFLWGGTFIIASDVLRLIIGTTPAWLTFAKWLTR